MKARICAALLLLVAGLSGCLKGKNNFLYVTGQGTNEVFGFTLHADGSLTPLGTPNFAAGSQPSSMAVHPPGDFFYIANFGGNALTLLNINTGNGELTVPPVNSALPPLTPPNIFNTGTGPLAVVVSPTAPRVYALNQISGNISAFLLDPGNGNLALITNPPQGSPNPLPAYGSFTAPTSMAISPKGNFLYVASPTQGQVFGFAVNNSDGSLAPVAGSPFAVGGTGGTPSWVTIDPSGRFLYVTDSAHNAVLGFSIGSDGVIAPISGSPFAAGVNPTSMTTDPGGALLFVSNTGDNTVSTFVIDAGTGALGAVSGSPFAVPGRAPGFLLSNGNFLYVAEQATNDIAIFSIGSNGVLAPAKTPTIGVAVSPQWISAASE
ncbi:MAG TPA: beta-propeller fold lactonase family protein [Candidatus Limnocylindrales bacterium]|nr:beta-propeller fold lactonase family protein [Candidatus Limnocylindrales bacterium]